MTSLQTPVAVCTAFLMLIATLQGSSPRQELTERDRNAVASTWEKNEKKIESARFTWEEQRVEVKGAGKQEPPLPADDLIWMLEKRMTFMGDKLDYFVTIRSRNDKKPEDIQRLNEWHLFDGKKDMEYIPPLDGHPNPHPHGSIHSSKNSVVNETTAFPFLWLCRMSKRRERHLLRSQANYDRDANGDPVIVFKDEGGNARAHITTSIWVNPTQAFSIVKYIMKQDSNVLLDFNISYQHDEKNDVWIPKSWRYVFPGLVSGTGKLSGYALNPTIDPDEFAHNFPVGTQVVTDDGRYIVRENDAKRIIAPEEYVAPYEDLLRTETGMALKKPSNWGRYVAIAVILAAISFFALRIFLRQKRSSFSRPAQ